MEGTIEIPKHDYAGACWWCGAPADSREHKHKRSDVRREFGTGPFKGRNAAVRWSGALVEPIQGPRSVRLTFAESMCARCNNERSQPFDQAQEAFHQYVRDHEQEIWRSREIRLDAVFGGDWADAMANVARYWAKHVGCRLVEYGFEVRDELRNFLDGQGPLASLGFQTIIRSDRVTMTKFFLKRDGYFPALFLGDVHAFADRRSGRVTRIESSLGYRWLETRWFYDPTTIPPVPVADLIPSPIFSLGMGHDVPPFLMRLGLEAAVRPRLRRILDWMAPATSPPDTPKGRPRSL